MCGRYALYSSAADLVELFHIVGELDVAPRYNVAPTQTLPVLTEGGHAVPMVWGLVPTWSKDGKGFINARAEGLFEKPAFRAAARRRRCLVPANLFYEWVKVPGGKQPMAIRRRDGRPFLMAGLWEPRRDAPPTYAVVTTAANALVAPIHDRMPVILEGAAADRWLDPGSSQDALAPLLGPWDADGFEAVPVDRRVNDVRFDDPACANVIADPGAGPR